jgi:hypothetical protein
MAGMEGKLCVIIGWCLCLVGGLFRLRYVCGRKRLSHGYFSHWFD